MAMIKAATRENQVKLTVSVPPSPYAAAQLGSLRGAELTSVVLQRVPRSGS